MAQVRADRTSQPCVSRAAASWMLPALGLWKSRLPVIVVPLLAAMRRISQHGELVAPLRHTSGHAAILEPGLVVLVATGTGYLRLPFSVTWWLLLLAAFALESVFLVGVATVVSLTVLLGWYGIRFQYPHAESALWGGALGTCPNTGSIPLACWRAWDLFVHALPALFMLYLHGPSVSPEGALRTGTVSLGAAAMALPLNTLWLWGLASGLPRQAGEGAGKRNWLWAMRLEDSNVAYGIFPVLPPAAWTWAYGSHWIACFVWAACLTLPWQPLVAYAIFFVHGFCWLPFTNAWWATFLTALFMKFSGLFESDASLFEGIVGTCALPVAVVWYGVQLAFPYTFRSLVDVWGLQPLAKYAPQGVSQRVLAIQHTTLWLVFSRVCDFSMHLVPTVMAAYAFRSKITPTAVLWAFPGNRMYWAGFCASSPNRLFGHPDTNLVYGVKPNLPRYAWSTIYAVHQFFCFAVLCGFLMAGIVSTASTLPVDAARHLS